MPHSQAAAGAWRGTAHRERFASRVVSDLTIALATAGSPGRFANARPLHHKWSHDADTTAVAVIGTRTASA
jgi:hypothetical protein